MTVQAAYICHRVATRTRVRIPAQRGDMDYFSRLADQLVELEGVHAVHVNARTASVLVEHGADDWLGQVVQQGILQWVPDGTAVNPVDRAENILKSFNHHLRASTAEHIDFRGFMLLLLIGGAIAQINRGQIMVPAVSLMWYALQLVMPARAYSTQRGVSQNDQA